MHIYAKPLTTLTIYILISLLIATILLHIGFRRNMRVTRIIAGILTLAALYGILSYTVIGRTASVVMDGEKAVGIELAQWKWGLGLAETDDVIMNTLGAAFGTVPSIFVFTHTRVNRRWRE